MEKAKKSTLGFWDLLSIGIGQIIGSGVMVLTGIAIGMTGRGIAWSFLVAAVLIIIPILCLAFLGSAIPSRGGMYTYVRDLIGRKTGFFFLALLVAGQLVLANYAIGFAEYAKDFFPGINTTIVAAVIMTVIFLINLRGVKTAAFIQNIMVVFLILALILFIAFGLPQVKNFDLFFQMKNIMPSGGKNFIAAVFLVRFALIGAEYINEFAEDTENPGKDIPRAMIVSVIVVSIIYFLIAIVAAGVLPVDEVAYKTLGTVAKKIFPTPIYLFFMCGGAMFALLSSLNAVFAWATKGLQVAVEEGWLPTWLAAENKKFGTPHFLLLVFYVMGMIPILTGGTIEVIALIGNNVGLIFAVLPIVAAIFLSKRNPEAYQNAKFKLPVWLLWILVIISVFIHIYGFYSSIDFIGPTGIKAIFFYCGLVIVYAFFREPYVKKIQAQKLN